MRELSQGSGIFRTTCKSLRITVHFLTASILELAQFLYSHSTTTSQNSFLPFFLFPNLFFHNLSKWYSSPSNNQFNCVSHLIHSPSTVHRPQIHSRRCPPPRPRPRAARKNGDQDRRRHLPPRERRQGTQRGQGAGRGPRRSGQGRKDD